MPLSETSAGGLPAIIRLRPALTGGVLALDLSSTVGWAYGPITDAIPATGTWHLPHEGGEGARYASYENELAAAMDRWHPSAVVLEAPLPLPALLGEHSNVAAVYQQITLHGFSKAECWRASVPCTSIDVHTVRGEVMGQRRLSKNIVKREVVAFCRKRGIAVQSHHAGDAALVWLWHRQRVMQIAPCAGPLWRDAG